MLCNSYCLYGCEHIYTEPLIWDLTPGFCFSLKCLHDSWFILKPNLLKKRRMHVLCNVLSLTYFNWKCIWCGEPFPVVLLTATYFLKKCSCHVVGKNTTFICFLAKGCEGYEVPHPHPMIVLHFNVTRGRLFSHLYLITSFYHRLYQCIFLISQLDAGATWHLPS